MTSTSFRLLFGFAVVSACFAMFFARSAMISPEVGRIVVPVSIAFSGITILAAIVANQIRSDGLRIRSLESRLRELESKQ